MAVHIVNIRKILIIFVFLVTIYVVGFLVITPLVLISNGVLQTKILKAEYYLYQRIFESIGKDGKIVMIAHGYRTWWCEKVEHCEINNENDK